MARPVSPRAWTAGERLSLRRATEPPSSPAIRRALQDGVARGYDGPLPRLPSGATLLLLEEEGETVGVLAFSPGPGEAAATLFAVAVAPHRRGRAAGLRAVIACERRLAREGVRDLYASVPRGNGRGVYFWLRSGYRPLPGPPRGAPPCPGGGAEASGEGCGWFYRRAAPPGGRRRRASRR